VRVVVHVTVIELGPDKERRMPFTITTNDHDTVSADCADADSTRRARGGAHGRAPLVLAVTPGAMPLVGPLRTVSLGPHELCGAGRAGPVTGGFR
jgi:hypothetical protein